MVQIVPIDGLQHREDITAGEPIVLVPPARAPLLQACYVARPIRANDLKLHIVTPEHSTRSGHSANLYGLAV